MNSSHPNYYIISAYFLLERTRKSTCRYSSFWPYIFYPNVDRFHRRKFKLSIENLELVLQTEKMLSKCETKRDYWRRPWGAWRMDARSQTIAARTDATTELRTSHRAALTTIPPLPYSTSNRNFLTLCSTL